MGDIEVSGRFYMDVFKLVDGKEHLIESYDDKNLVVNTGKWNFCELITTGTAYGYVQKIGFGVGTNPPHVADITLSSYYSNYLIPGSIPASNIVIFNWILSQTEANGIPISEYGLFTYGGDLFARKVRSTILKEDNMIFRGSWTITFT